MRKFERVSRAKDINIKLPERSTIGSAGYDFYAIEDIILAPKSTTLIKTGIKAYMEDNEVLLLYIRSSLAYKHNLMLSNSVGVVDSSYTDNVDNEGEIGFLIYNNNDIEYQIKKNDKIGQGIFTTYLTTDDDKADKVRTSAAGYQRDFIDAFCEKLETGNRKDVGSISDYCNMTMEIFIKILNNYIANDENPSYPINRFGKYMQQVLCSTFDTSESNKFQILKLIYNLHNLFAMAILKSNRLENEDIHKVKTNFNIIDSLNQKEFFNKIIYPLDVLKLNNDIQISALLSSMHIISADMYLNDKDNNQLYNYLPQSTSLYIMRYLGYYIDNQLNMPGTSYTVESFARKCLINSHMKIDIKDEKLREEFYKSINISNAFFICGLLSKGLDISERVFEIYLHPERKCNDENEIMFILAPLYLSYYYNQYEKDDRIQQDVKSCAQRFINKYLQSYKEKVKIDNKIKEFIDNSDQNDYMFDVLKSFKSNRNHESIFIIKDFIKWFKEENILLKI